jgi:maltose phosphorylase
MAGSWMSVIYGFGGMRIKDGTLNFNPNLPKEWHAYSFKIRFRKALLHVKLNKKLTEISNLSKIPVEIVLKDKKYLIDAESTISVPN